MHKSRIAVLAAVLLAGTAPIFAQPAAEAPATKARYGSWGVDLTARDMSLKPGDDFWRFANNTWFQHNPIPADRTGYSLWTLLDEDIERQVRAIVESGASDPTGRQVGDFYASWMDEA